MNWFEMGVMKYWAPTSSMDSETKKQRLQLMSESNRYIFAEKYDGNFSRAVITPKRNALQTRGISKKTGEYGEIQDKVFFWEDVLRAFPNGDTVILGEVILPGGIDKDVGTITRCLTKKAIERQKDKKLEWRIFDILALDGTSFMDKPIEERIKYIPEVELRINNPLVKGVQYYEMDEHFFEKLNKILSRGGEGVVCYEKGILYTPDKRSSAWTTCKVKQEIQNEIDCFIIGYEPSIRDYTGKYLDTWEYWLNAKTGEKLLGEYYLAYTRGEDCLIPITKSFYHGWPGAIRCGVYDDNGNIYEICKVSGLEETFKEEFKNNPGKWLMCPLTISGMMLSSNSVNEKISVRHPIIKSIREGDIDVKDCTLAKIIS